jgi:transposase-like protein
VGHPTKNALKGWHRECEQRLDLPVGDAYAAQIPKYSHAQKEAAVAHYLAHDRCVAATMRALDYPRRGTLTVLVREALPEARRVVVGSVGRRKYSGKLVQAGVMALCMREDSAQAVADKLGLCRPMLYNWGNQLLGREAPASMKRTDQTSLSQERDALERESLRRAVR